MKECKCKCGGCVKKGGAFMLETIYINGGYTYDDLRKLWGPKYYDYLFNKFQCYKFKVRFFNFDFNHRSIY